MSSRAAAEVESFLFARHENAAAEDEPACGAADDGFVCTRECGHDDDHEAHGLMGKVMHRWPALEAARAA